MSRARTILLILPASFLLAGLAEPFTARPGEPYSAAAAIHILAIAVLCYAWCKADAASRGAVPPGGSAIFAALLPPLGIPLYFFRSRSVRRALVSIGKAFLFFLIALVLFALGMYAGEGLRT